MNAISQNPITQDDVLPLIVDRRVLLTDIAVVFAATALTAWLCVRYEVSEALFKWTRSFEGLQFDELPVILLVMAMGSMWFALRRYREERVLLTRQRLIDARLAAVLAENRKLAQQ